MAKITSNQYVVQQSSKQQWHFFHLPTTGICYKKKVDGQWNDYEILLKEGQGDFDVIIDAKDNIHLICQDKLGSIIYLMYNGQQWHKYIILQSKTNRPYPKHFRILYVNKWINLFYIIDYKDKSLLVHHMLDNSNVPPAVVDYVVKNERPYSLSVDNSNNIHVYYQSEIDSGKIGYRIYLWSKKIWGEFTSIEQDKNTSLPYTLIDEEDNIHLVYLKKYDKFYDIIYTRKPFNSFDKTLWDKETIINSRCYGDAQPVMFKTDNKLWILWQQDIKVYSSSSDDDGVTWSKASQFIAGRYGNISIFGCRLPPSSNKESIICDLCYGYSTNSDINLYLLANHLDQLPSKKKDPEYKIPGYEVEEFAQKNKNAFMPSSFEQTYNKSSTSGRNTTAFPHTSYSTSDDPFFDAADNTANNDSFHSLDKTSDEAFFHSIESASDPAAFFRSSSSSVSTQADSSTDNVESTKIKIMLNMLQEELSQTKKKLIELTQMSKIDEEFKKELDTNYISELKALKENFQELLARITHIEETQTSLINSNIERINKEIALLKRNTNKINFEDLMKKTETANERNEDGG